jgi:hypothetical protein
LLVSAGGRCSRVVASHQPVPGTFRPLACAAETVREGSCPSGAGVRPGGLDAARRTHAPPSTTAHRRLRTASRVGGGGAAPATEVSQRVRMMDASPHAHRTPVARREPVRTPANQLTALRSSPPVTAAKRSRRSQRGLGHQEALEQVAAEVHDGVPFPDRLDALRHPRGPRVRGRDG